jgi:hypothetical protein
MYICAEEDVSKLQHLALKTQNETTVRKMDHMFVPYVTFFPPDGTCIALALPSSTVLSPVPITFCSLSLALILVDYLQQSQIWCWATYSKFCFGWGLLFLVPCFSGEIMLFGSVFVETPRTSIVCNA